MVFPAECEDLRSKEEEEMFLVVVAGWSFIRVLTAL